MKNLKKALELIWQEKNINQNFKEVVCGRKNTKSNRCRNEISN